ncbi:MAG: hypothetical protein PVG43_08170 [Nitrosopumilaceae archaeon]
MKKLHTFAVRQTPARGSHIKSFGLEYERIILVKISFGIEWGSFEG